MGTSLLALAKYIYSKCGGDEGKQQKRGAGGGGGKTVEMWWWRRKTKQKNLLVVDRASLPSSSLPRTIFAPRISELEPGQ